MIDVDLMQDASEIIHYNRTGIPLYTRTGELSEYPNMRALCHWHEDIEWVRILDGRMNYDVNGKTILLKKNDCIMINSRQMHFGSSCGHEDCRFLCIVFHPLLLQGCRTLYQEYVLSVTEKQNPAYLYLEARTPENHAVTQLLDRLSGTKPSENPACEIDAAGILHLLWGHAYRLSLPFLTQESRQINTDISLQKTMVSYIYQHYSEKLSLNEIAAAGNICRSKCCMIFKRFLQQSPIDFLNKYRLEVSCNLLLNTDLSITDIALACGFNNLSYFSKLFFKSYGHTPVQFRKNKKLSPVN